MPVMQISNQQSPLLAPLVNDYFPIVLYKFKIFDNCMFSCSLLGIFNKQVGREMFLDIYYNILF